MAYDKNRAKPMRGDELRAIREGLGLNRPEFAKLFNLCGEAHLYKIETDKQKVNPQLSILVELLVENVISIETLKGARGGSLEGEPAFNIAKYPFAIFGGEYSHENRRGLGDYMKCFATLDAAESFGAGYLMGSGEWVQVYDLRQGFDSKPVLDTTAICEKFSL